MSGTYDQSVDPIARSPEALRVLLEHGSAAHREYVENRWINLRALSREIVQLARARGEHPVSFLMDVLAGLDIARPRCLTCSRCGSSNANHLGNGDMECCACGHGWGAW